MRRIGLSSAQLVGQLQQGAHSHTRITFNTRSREPNRVTRARIGRAPSSATGTNLLTHIGHSINGSQEGPEQNELYEAVSPFLSKDGATSQPHPDPDELILIKKPQKELKSDSLAFGLS